MLAGLMVPDGSKVLGVKYPNYSPLCTMNSFPFIDTGSLRQRVFFYLAVFTCSFLKYSCLCSCGAHSSLTGAVL